MPKQNTNFDTIGMFSYDAFCVYDLLSKEPKNSKAQFLGNHSVEGYALPPDIYAPDGIPSMGIYGETVIEVKKNLSYYELTDFKSYIDVHSRSYNIVVVYQHSTLSSVPSPAEVNNHVIKYVCFEELKANKKKSSKQTDKYYSDKAKNSDWLADRKRIIAEANEAAKLGNNVLFLGAGVSMSAKMPSWNELLEGLMGEVKQLEETTLSAFKELSTHVLQECGDSYLIMARYLRSAILQHDKSANFYELIQKYLYNENSTSSLIDALTLIIQQKKVNEVITYNFDDILEQNLKSKGMIEMQDFTSISKDAEIKGHNTLPIYHVHGIIPKQGAADTVVFSEDEYHKRYSNSFHWSNVEQLHAMGRMHCFFVGLSMNDPNLRRLLDIAHNMNSINEEPHYAFLKRTKLEEYCMPGVEKGCKYVHVSKSLVDVRKQKEIYNLNYGVIENMFRELGVKVIWYEKHEELPGLITEVFAMSKYKFKATEDLLLQCNAHIDEIKNIELGLPQFNIATIGLTDVADFLSYKAQHEVRYKELIYEAKDMLNELSNRIEINDLETINKLRRQIPSYNDTFSGFAPFYRLWYESVKTCLSN